jgi:hypothetical protein
MLPRGNCPLHDESYFSGADESPNAKAACK